MGNIYEWIKWPTFFSWKRVLRAPLSFAAVALSHRIEVRTRERERDEDRDDKRAKSYLSRDISKMCLSIKINKKKKESLILKRKLLFTELKFFFKFQ